MEPCINPIKLQNETDTPSFILDFEEQISEMIIEVYFTRMTSNFIFHSLKESFCFTVRCAENVLLLMLLLWLQMHFDCC